MDDRRRGLRRDLFGSGGRAPESIRGWPARGAGGWGRGVTPGRRCLARSRAILRRARIPYGHDRVDPRVGAAGGRRGTPRRDRRDGSIDAPEARQDPGPPASGSCAGMSVPLSQMWAVASYVVKQRLAGRARYPLVLMLEPLFRCNLAWAGCGKIQYPAQILRKDLTVEQCLRAVEECGAPIVSLPGGEPLVYPEVGRLVQELVARESYVYICYNALLLMYKLSV